MIKSLETVAGVTHTQVFLNNVIASDCKTFNVPKNRKRNLKFNCILNNSYF